jgi:hypothetical protein
MRPQAYNGLYSDILYHLGGQSVSYANLFNKRSFVWRFGWDIDRRSGAFPGLALLVLRVAETGYPTHTRLDLTIMGAYMIATAFIVWPVSGLIGTAGLRVSTRRPPASTVNPSQV